MLNKFILGVKVRDALVMLGCCVLVGACTWLLSGRLLRLYRSNLSYTGPFEPHQKKAIQAAVGVSFPENVEYIQVILIGGQDPLLVVQAKCPLTQPLLEDLKSCVGIHILTDRVVPPKVLSAGTVTGIDLHVNSKKQTECVLETDSDAIIVISRTDLYQSIFLWIPSSRKEISKELYDMFKNK